MTEQCVPHMHARFTYFLSGWNVQMSKAAATQLVGSIKHLHKIPDGKRKIKTTHTDTLCATVQLKFRFEHHKSWILLGVRRSLILPASSSAAAPEIRIRILPGPSLPPLPAPTSNYDCIPEIRQRSRMTVTVLPPRVWAE